MTMKNKHYELTELFSNYQECQLSKTEPHHFGPWVQNSNLKINKKINAQDNMERNLVDTFLSSVRMKKGDQRKNIFSNRKVKLAPIENLSMDIPEETEMINAKEQKKEMINHPKFRKTYPRLVKKQKTEERSLLKRDQKKIEKVNRTVEIGFHSAKEETKNASNYPEKKEPQNKSRSKSQNYSGFLEQKKHKNKILTNSKQCQIHLILQQHKNGRNMRIPQNSSLCTIFI